MKAAVLVNLNKPLDIASDIELPALRRGQVLVKLAYSGVCHSQIMEARGRRGDDPWLPHLLGHEGSGRVIQIGEGVTKVVLGDMVILGWIKGDGIEAGGAQYQRAGKTVNAGGVTTFNEYAVVSENRVVILPEGVPLDVAVLFGCAIPTGAGIVVNELQPRENASFAIFGLGGIGLSALMATQLFTPKTVIAIDINDEKLALARDFGATHTINSRNEDALAEILRITPGGVDYSVDASGHTSVIEIAFKAVRRNGGLCVFASHPERGAQIKIDPYELICGKQIRGSWGGAVYPDRDIPRFAKLYTEGKLPLHRLISRSYSLDQINAALDDLENGYVGRPLIEIDPTI